VVDIIEQLDTSELEQAYSGGGSAPYPPKMMLALLFYCYAKGIFSSRKIEEATRDLIPVAFIAGGTHPDHDTINTFRKNFLSHMSRLFIVILQIAYGMGILKLGAISIDGTKIKANASKRKAMSWAYACKLEEQLRKEVEALLKRAELENRRAEQEINIPAELQRREVRLVKIKEVKTELELRAAKRYAQEQAEYNAKLKEREEKQQRTGRKLGGKPPKAPEAGPRAKDQANFTDSDSRIMPTASGFEQAYNAQASVDIATMLIVSQHISQNPNDKQEVTPALEALSTLPDDLGCITKAAADSGYFSRDNTQQFENAGIEPFMPTGRQHHNPTLEERFPKEPDAPKNPDSVEATAHRMKTETGRKFYALRKSTVEPVFGIIKEVMGFRRFMLRGLKAVQGEWNLVCIAYNLKRLCALNL
jgi:transposase